MQRRISRLRRQSRGLWHYHLMLRVLLLCLLGWKLWGRQWGHAGLCVLTLALVEIPALAETLLHLKFPPLLEVVVTLFAVCANLGGEMLGLYLRLPFWDSGLHLLWGILSAMAGCAFLRMLQKQELTPLAALMGALGFSALTSVCWEFFEYFMDVVFHTDMQKSAWITRLSSLLLNPAGENRAVTAAVETVVVNGEVWPGLPDIGLRDTMSDLMLNFAGSVLAGALCAWDARPGRRLRLVALLSPTRLETLEKGAGHEKGA